MSSAVANVPTVDTASLVSGRLIAKNSVWNFLGQIAPLLVALVAIPRLVQSLGTDRFGILTIAWIIVGTLSFFDFGLGRALTNLVAQKLGEGEEGVNELSPIIWTATLSMFVLGFMGAAVFAFGTPFLVHHLLKVNPELQAETTRSLLVLSCSIPIVICTTAFRGVLEAQQKFGIVNVIRVPMGVTMFLFPLLMLHWTHRLTPIVTLLVIARIFFLVAYLIVTVRIVPEISSTVQIRLGYMPQLLRYGGWMTVSNVVSPLMAYVDRFLIGSLISLAAVAYYATSYEVATKLLILPAAVVSVLFPAFSTALVSDRKKAGELFRYSLRLIMMSLFPLSLTIVLLAKDGLAFWLGIEFATKSFAALQWLAVGAFTNGVAFVPFCFLQASGRPDLTGKLNLLELPIYLVALWYLTAHYGIIGAALAWALRVTVDCVLLLWLASTITGNKSTLYWFATFTTCLSMMIWLATQFQSIQIKVWVIALCLCILIYLISRGIIPMRRASCASSE